MSSIPKSIKCTLNPDPTSFIYEWVKPFLDEEDFPIKELSGRTRYFVVIDGNLVTDWDKEKLELETGKPADTYTYIPATLDDNKKLDDLDPSYRTKLDSMPEAKRKQLLMGCWASVEESGMYFKREYLKKASHIPLNCMTVRAYDLASSAGDTPETRGCDATHGVLMSKSPDGFFYIHGSKRYRKRVGERDLDILNTAKRDGEDVTVIIPKDTGAGGAAAYMYLAKMLIAEGFTVKEDSAPKTASKLVKAAPFFSACENGLVYIVESSIEPSELKLFYQELELFDGSRSTRNRHDETVDSCSSAFTHLSKTKYIPSFTVPSLTKLNSFNF